jgi:hypothetical protein
MHKAITVMRRGCKMKLISGKFFHKIGIINTEFNYFSAVYLKIPDEKCVLLAVIVIFWLKVLGVSHSGYSIDIST